MIGLVINTISYKEKSKIVYLYTPNGIISVKALDVMKKNLGFTITLNHVEFNMTNSNFPTLIEYSLKNSYYNLHQDLKKLQIAIIIIDVLKKLEGEYPHERIFNFVIKCLDTLMNCNNPLYVLSIFLVKMMYIFGVKPTLNKCVKCGSTPIVDFDIYDGGGLCKDCGMYNQSNVNILNALDRLYKDSSYDESLYSNIDYNQLLKVIYDYYSIHVNFKLKDYKF